MRRLSLMILVVLLCLGATAAFAAARPASSSTTPADPGVRKIVVFRSGLAGQSAAAVVARHGGDRLAALPLVGGAVVALPNEAAARALLRENAVVSVEDDIVLQALAKPTPVLPAQQLPWGVARIDAPAVWATATGDPVKVGIIDTGIEATHPDLAANVKGGASFVGYTSKYGDDNGHGTHVAGIVAAANDAVGVVGVAHAADLYAIKVLDRRGSGYLSDIIEGLEWAIVNDMDVVNMSLGTNAYSSAFATAVQKTADAGVIQVAAAGNDGPYPNSVDYPGAFPEVIAVAATDSANVVASWSSRGPQVALAAPGVSIHSTYKGSTYKVLSGTSMAAPHVTGTVALMLEEGWTPAGVKARLQATATDLGPSGADTAYGAGLVQADAALGL